MQVYSQHNFVEIFPSLSPLCLFGASSLILYMISCKLNTMNEERDSVQDHYKIYYRIESHRGKEK
jgi:hypothetical protein